MLYYIFVQFSLGLYNNLSTTNLLLKYTQENKKTNLFLHNYNLKISLISEIIYFHNFQFPKSNIIFQYFDIFFF